MTTTRQVESAHRTPRQDPPSAGAGPVIEPRWPQDVLDELPLNRRHALVFALCAAGLLFESLNLQLMSFAAPMIAEDWGLGPERVGGLISAAIVGMLGGTYLFGALADRIGRRPVFQITVGLFSVLTALSGFAASYGQLMAARFLAGLGIGGSIPVETAVMAEFTPARWRARVIAIWAMALPLGALAAPLCVAAMPDSLGWRGLLFLGGVPALLVLVLRRAIPETPQFLAARGRASAAAAAVSWLQGSLAAAPADAGAAPPQRSRPEGLLFSRGLRAATIASWGLYFTTFFAYYGFVLWLPALLTAMDMPKADILRFMVLIALSGLAGRAVLLTFANRLRQGWALGGCGLAAAIGLAAFAAAEGEGVRLTLAGLSAFFLEGTFSVLIPYVAGLYPASARATGVGWAGGMGRIGTALAPLSMGFAAARDPVLPVLLLAGVAGGAALVGVLVRPGPPDLERFARRPLRASTSSRTPDGRQRRDV